jgi:hypothetical protein
MVWDNIETFSNLARYTQNPFIGTKDLENFKAIN